MDRRFVSIFSMAMALAYGGQASAQQAPADETLPEAVAESDAGASYELSTGNDTGTSTIRQKEIEARSPGSGDVNQLLKILPTVQFDHQEGLGERSRIQDIRPAEISISGGRAYENMFVVDGVEANSAMDTTNDAPQNYNELAGPSPQSFWFDSNLVGEITLRDSNVSAEHGKFTGGVVQIETRAPARRFGATFNASVDSDALVNYVMSQASRDELAGAPVPETPKFTKYRIGGTVDLPVTDRFALLVGVNHSYAEVLYTTVPNYGSQRVKRFSSSDNYLVKAIYDISDATTLTGQFGYTPYVSISSTSNSFDNIVHSKGGGYTGRLGVNHSGALDWSLDATYAYNESGRTAPPNHYLIPGSSNNADFCTTTNCSRGFIGDLNQSQENYGLSGKLALPVGGDSRFRVGFDYDHVRAHRDRPVDSYSYVMAFNGANVVCSAGNSFNCATGQYALTRRQTYFAYDATVNLDTIAAWAEFEGKFGPVDLRVGGRYDHDSFLDNHNFSPRASVTLDLPIKDWSITAGANRYYGRSMVGYAIRDKLPNLTLFDRVYTISGGQRIYGDTWTLTSETNATQYGLSNLDTPYSDELTAALTARLLGGTARVKGILRWGKDEFVRTPQETSSDTNLLGNPITVRTWYLSNRGRSRYEGVSLEWTRTFGNHSVALNTNFSKTRTTNDDYIEGYDDTLFGELRVLYNGQVMTKGEIMYNNSRLNMASPFILNGSWTARWFDDRLTTNLNLRFRDGFSRIEDSGVNERVDGVLYDVYDVVRYKASIDTNLNAQLILLRDGDRSMALDMRVTNLLNKVPVREWDDEGEPYQMGRAFWLGVKFKF